jgi:hypothetical protein
VGVFGLRVFVVLVALEGGGLGLLGERGLGLLGDDKMRGVRGLVFGIGMEMLEFL